MREKLTLSLLTRNFTHLLSNLVDVKFSPEPASFIAMQLQAHADMAILPEHLYKSLDDVTQELLLPAAQDLAAILLAARASYTFELGGPDDREDIECSIHRYNGCSVRGMVQRGIETNGPDGGLLIFDAFRFDVLYRSETVQ